MKIVAVTSCIAGIAHTYMAAESLEIAAKKKGYQIKVETMGSIGSENVLTEEEIKEADVVVIASDKDVQKERFSGKPILEVGTHDAMKNGEQILERVNEAVVYKNNNLNNSHTNSNTSKKQSTSLTARLYKHLMNGVSHMIPFVVAGGILIALSFIFGIKAFQQEGTLASALMKIGGDSAFALMIPILAGFISFSIADRPGLAPGMVGGMLAASTNSGFLGGILAGFLAGYVVKFLKEKIVLPPSLKGIMPILVIPVISCLVVGLTMIYVIGTPISYLNNFLNNWLSNLSGANAIVLGLVLGTMISIDMGGVLNKVAYAFAVASLTSGQPSMAMAAVMAGGMVPPLGLALATIICKNKFTLEEREAGKTAWILGVSFITEGAIPFAAADPGRVLPSTTIGAAVAGALSMLFKCKLAVPHGGAFVFLIPGAVTNLLLYITAIIAGTIVTAVMVRILKKDI
ncbi:PTS fructose transporter subunit IIC [Abyssisolibacter fermentans]|uniref:PTS fructose transporter subunit IIC n=1 Tax=Abyssisolibacter fermentans TaxID=1766203 RepID=UPI00082B63F3|nr:fructose-specific PTS transporter subunit EIIC [Abyssisolibacter fermentans]